MTFARVLEVDRQVKGSGVLVVGGGLAGSEAAWQVARMGIPVTLVEMRPHVMTPAHKTSGLAELVCSNSLGVRWLQERIRHPQRRAEDLQLANH